MLHAYRRRWPALVSALLTVLVLTASAPALADASPPATAGTGTPQATGVQPAWGTEVPVWVLRYQVLHVVEPPGTPGDLVLVVTNPTPSWVVLTFPSAQKVDFSLWRDGGEWWRASWGETYAQVVTRDVLGPYQSRLYRMSLPQLPPGSYQVAASFLANGNRYPVAWTQIWLDGGEIGQLTYALSVRGSTWAGNLRLGLSVSNPAQAPVPLYYPEGWAVRAEIRDAAGHVVWQRTTPAPDTWESFRAGGSRYHSFPLPALAPGHYTARAWFAPAGPEPIASASFTVN